MNGHEDYDDRPVRMYMITSGRAHPTRNTVRPETLLVRADPSKPLPISASREQRTLLDMCRHLISVAEAAAHLGLPVSVVVVVASDLADAGYLVVRSTQTERPDPAILQEVLDGLRRL